MENERAPVTKYEPLLYGCLRIQRFLQSDWFYMHLISNGIPQFDHIWNRVGIYGDTTTSAYSGAFRYFCSREFDTFAKLQWNKN